MLYFVALTRLCGKQGHTQPWTGLYLALMGCGGSTLKLASLPYLASSWNKESNQQEKNVAGLPVLMYKHKQSFVPNKEW